jgi:hypothetical protein
MGERRHDRIERLRQMTAAIAALNAVADAQHAKVLSPEVRRAAIEERGALHRAAANLHAELAEEPPR